MPPDDLLDAVSAVGGALADLIERLPAEVVHRRAEAAEWSIAEIGGHCAEFPVFQAAQARRIAVTPGVRFGRREDDADRLAAAARFGRAAPAEIAAAVRAAVAEARGILSAIPPEGWQRTGENVFAGTVSAEWVARQLVLAHLRGHLEQARRAAGEA